MDHEAVYKKLLSEFDQYSECCVCTEQGDLVLFGCDDHGVCVKCYRSIVSTETARMLAEWSTHSMPITTVRCPMCRDPINVKANFTEKLRFQPLQTHRLIDSCKQGLHEALGLPAPVKTLHCGLCQANFDDSKSFREHSQQCILLKPCRQLNCTKRTMKAYCEEHLADRNGVTSGITDTVSNRSTGTIVLGGNTYTSFVDAFEVEHSSATRHANPARNNGAGTGTTLRGGNTHTRFGAAYVMEHGFANRWANRPSAPVTAVADDTALFGQVGPIPPAGDGLSANAVMTEFDPATDRAASQLLFQRFSDLTPQELATISRQAFNLTDPPVANADLSQRDVVQSAPVDEAHSPSFVATDPDGGGTNATLSTISVSARTGIVRQLANPIPPSNPNPERTDLVRHYRTADPNITLTRTLVPLSNETNEVIARVLDGFDPPGGGDWAIAPAVVFSERTGVVQHHPNSLEATVSDPVDEAHSPSTLASVLDRLLPHNGMYRQITGWTERVLGVLDRLLTYNGMYRQITTIHGLHNITLDGQNPPAVYRRDDELAFVPRGSDALAACSRWCNHHPVDDFTWKTTLQLLKLPHLGRARCDGLDGRTDARRHVTPTVAHLFVHPFPDQVVPPVATLLAEPGTIDTVHGLQHLQHARAAAAVIYHNYATLAIVNNENPDLYFTFSGLCSLAIVNEFDWKEACSQLRLPINNNDPEFQHVRQLDAEQFFACLAS